MTTGPSGGDPGPGPSAVPAGRGGGVAPRWLTVFLDRTGDDLDRAVAFWSTVTGTSLSSPRGDRDQFATLVPAVGDPYLRVQRLVEGPSGTHLDLHVDDLDRALAVVLDAGAVLDADHGAHRALRSPGGYRFCLVTHRGESTRPVPVGGPGRRVVVDQLCLDVPPEVFGAETAFWARVLGRDPVTGSRPEFVVLEREPGSPLRVLVQRLDVAPADGVVSGHLDLACDDVAAAVARHRSLGAAVVGSGPVWTVLTDPGGVVYCLTARSPDSGRLAG